MNRNVLRWYGHVERTEEEREWLKVYIWVEGAQRVVEEEERRN
jgi:hypothetical protein